jgi:hypothetical protein
MTTLFPITVTCAICNTDSEHTAIGSTNQFGSRDLDFRPPEMMRSTMRHWIQRCPSCGYCAGRIDEATANAPHVIKTQAYLAQLNHDAFPMLANTFLCASQIMEVDEQWSAAAQAALNAAWSCDDEMRYPDDAAKMQKAADECRKRAISLFNHLMDSGGKVAEEAGIAELLLSDLLRRSGQFEAAETVAVDGLAQQPNEAIAQALEFEKARALEFDRQRYTFAQVSRD